MKNIAISKVCTVLWVALLQLNILTATAQWPPAITIEPINATAYDEMTLIFDPSKACAMSGTLAGLPSIAIHSGVTIQGVGTWQNAVGYDETGYNGQSTLMMPTGDGRFSITYVPADFYGLSGQTVTQICAVFNNGTDWTQDGRDYLADSLNCFDFFIPINYPFANPSFHFLVNMTQAMNDGLFDPQSDSLFACFSQAGQSQLYPTGEYGIYEGLHGTSIEAGETYSYKLRINEDYFEEITRTSVATFSSSEVVIWWNDDPDPDASYTIADFEDGTNGIMDMHVLGCGVYDNGAIHPLSETFFIVDNPGPSSVNPSDKVLKFIRRGLWCGSMPWGGFWSNCEPDVNVNFLRYVHVKVWKPRISPLKFKLENGTLSWAEIPSRYPQTSVNQWEEIVFDFSNMYGTYDIVGLFPDYEVPLTLWDDMDMYIDDIVLTTSPVALYVGVDENESRDISIYPNPASDRIRISGGNEGSELFIYNMRGQLVYQTFMHDVEQNIDILGFSRGIYMVVVSDGRLAKTRKLLIN